MGEDRQDLLTRYELMAAMLRGQPTSFVSAPWAYASADLDLHSGEKSDATAAELRRLIRRHLGELIPAEASMNICSPGDSQHLANTDSKVDRLFWIARGEAEWTSEPSSTAAGFAAVVTSGGLLYLPEGSRGTHRWSQDAIGCELSWTDVSATERRLAWQALSAGNRTFRGMPQHWRAFWHTMWSTFVFRLEREPYEHLAPEFQGMAGAPIDQNHDTLIGRLRGNPMDTLALSETPHTSVRFSVSPAIAFEVADSDGAVAVRDPNSAEALVLPAGTTDALRYFSVARTVDEAVSAMAGDGVDVEREALSAAVGYLAAHKVLLPHRAPDWR